MNNQKYAINVEGNKQYRAICNVELAMKIVQLICNTTFTTVLIGVLYRIPFHRHVICL